jgi:putative DNA primase/helicase
MTGQDGPKVSIELDEGDKARRARRQVLRDAALALAAASVPVFAAHSIRADGSCTCGRPDCDRPGKHPRTEHGLEDATTDESVVTEWWRRWPTANIAIATGEAGLVVIDVDVKGGAPGRGNWDKLVAELGPQLEDTALVCTQSGGLHALFRAGEYEIASSVGALAPGIDIRARGGYIIAPPSVGVDGPYTWVEGHGLDRLRDLPAALAERIGAAKQVGSSKRSRLPKQNTGPETIPAGKRNTVLASMAGAMRRKGMTEGEMLAALTIANTKRCDPPLSEDELRGVVASIATYEPALPHEGLTDTGNANRLVRLYGEQIRYCAIEKSWYVYDGRCWQRDETLAVEDLVKEAHRTIYEEAARCTEDQLRKQIASWAKRSESRAARRAAIECARSDPRIAVRPQQFDADLWLLNCPNGTLDLHDGSLRAHDPKDLLTCLTGAPYEPAARSDLWERFFSEATGGDTELQAWLQRAAGSSCTGDCRDEVYFVLVGETATGKTTFTEALMRTLGSYAVSLNQEAFLAHSTVGGTKDSIMPLEHRRMALCAEFARGHRFDEALIKQLVGGDTVTGRRIYEHEHSFTPTAKLWLHTNHVPHLSDDDDASWRRIRIVPFRNAPAVPDEQVKKTLFDLSVSGPAILAWLVSGCLAWQRQGLGLPQVVACETRALRLEMDRMGEFFEEVCVFEDGAWTTSHQLRLAYTRYVQDNDVPRELRVSAGKAMAAYLKARGCVSEGRQGVRGWAGIRLIGRQPEGTLFPPEAC